MTPLVSIVCISYNHEKYIRQCLDGFLMQKTSFPFEIIISDDVSTDSTHDIIKEYIRNDQRGLIIDVSPQKNLGVINNWRQAHEKAGGKYIAYCEGDDYWLDSEKLQKQVDFLESHPDHGLCFTNYEIRKDLCSGLSQPVFKDPNVPNSITFESHLFNAGYIAPMTWLYRRDIFRQIEFSYERMTDASFAMALDFLALSNVGYLDCVTAVYRTHEGSAANQTSAEKAFKYQKGIFETQLEYAIKYNISQQKLLKLKTQGYVERMLPAVDAGNGAFVKEALGFFSGEGLEMKWFVLRCREYVRYKNLFEQISQSYAYRLGKAVLKPFKFFKNRSV